MRVTAIRMGHDLWGLLEAEAAQLGVSVSQYVREAALARAAAAAAARGEDPYELLALSGRAPEAAATRPSSGRGSSRVKRVREDAQRTQLEAQAIRAEGRQIRRRYRSGSRNQPRGG
jgi:hypothetical protein